MSYTFFSSRPTYGPLYKEYIFLSPQDESSLEYSNFLVYLEVDDDGLLKRRFLNTGEGIRFCDTLDGVTIELDPLYTYQHPTGDGYQHVPANGTTNAGKFLRAGGVPGLAEWVGLSGDWMHPTGDGNLHVPATGTTNTGKVLTAGDEAGELYWGALEGLISNSIHFVDTGAGASPGASFDGETETYISYNTIGAVGANAAISPGTKTKITYDAKGLVTAGNNLTASDLPEHGLHAPDVEAASVGKFLKAVGTDGSLAWDTVPESLLLSSEAPEDLGTTASSGTDTMAARSDHVHATDGLMTTGHAANSITGLGTTGSSTLVSREDHTHTGVYEPADSDIQTHITSAHAPSNAQKNSDITKAEIETKLIGEISSHTHDYAPSSHVGATGDAHGVATTSVNGFMSATDKSKLDAVASSANNYTHPNHTGDVTSVGDGETTIAAKAISNTKMSDMSANSLKGNPTAIEASPIDITFPANTFPARASTGNLLAKSISDFSLGLVASADAATARTTLAAVHNSYPEVIWSGGAVTVPGTWILTNMFWKADLRFNVSTTGLVPPTLTYLFDMGNDTVNYIPPGETAVITISTSAAYAFLYGYGYYTMMSYYDTGDWGLAAKIKIRHYCRTSTSPLTYTWTNYTEYVPTGKLSRFYVPHQYAYIQAFEITIEAPPDKKVSVSELGWFPLSHNEGGFSAEAAVFDKTRANTLVRTVYLRKDVSTLTGSITPYTGEGFFSILKTPLIKPASDSTTAIQLTKADGATPVMTLDTTNSKVGIKKTPVEELDVAGNIKGSGYLELNEITEPDAGAADTARVYAFDDTGTTRLAFKDSAGAITVLGTGSGSSYTHPNHTGDVTSVGDGATTIANQAVTLTKMANVATGTVFYRKTANAGSPEVQTLATLKSDLGLTGTNSGDQTITLTGAVTGTGTGSFATTLAADIVSNANLANMAANTVKVNATTGAANPSDLSLTEGTVLGRITGGNIAALTATQLRTLLNVESGAQANQNAFSTLAVSGQTSVAADSASDTLTLVAGSNITITTNATADSVTIAATGSGVSLSSTAPSNLAATAAVGTGTTAARSDHVHSTSGLMTTSHAANSITGFGGTGSATTVSRSDHTHSGYLTAHPSVSAASSVNNSGITYIQDLTFDSFGHTTAITSAAIQSASTSQVGVVQLSSSTSSTSTTLAATASAVKAAYDRYSISGTANYVPYYTSSSGMSITNYVYASGTGCLGAGTASPTALLHLAAGTSSRAPLKFTSGTALTTAADGALEYHGSHLYFTIGTTRYQLDQQSSSGLTGSGTSNRIAKFTGTSTIGNSVIYENATYSSIGIGSSPGSEKLLVSGTIKITGGSPGAGKVLTSDAAGLASWQAPSGGDAPTIVISATEPVAAVDGDIWIKYV